MQKSFELNDHFRKTLEGGYVFFTPTLFSKSDEERVEILNLVRHYEDFNQKNDPYKNHTFGSFDFKGELIAWKIIYFDKSFKTYPKKTTKKTLRFLFIMNALEYAKCS